MGDDTSVMRLLAEVYNVAAPPDRQRAAEAQLKHFSATPGGVSWAVTSITSASLDGQALFFAAAVLEAAAARRWGALPPDHQASVYHCLWASATSPPPSQPPYVTAKLVAALAHLACVAWQPQFWAEVQVCLGDARRAEAGIRLLDATMEQLHELAQATAVGLRGKVLSAQVPAIQAHFKEAQPMALSMLCSLLQSIARSLSPPGNPHAQLCAAAALGALQNVLANLSALLSTREPASSAIAELLCGFMGLIDTPGDPSASSAAVAAMDCLWEMLVKPQEPAPARAMVSTLLRALCATCRALLQRWAARPCPRGAAGDEALSALIRLVVRLFETQLGRIESDPGLAEQLPELLSLLSRIMLARRSAADLLVVLLAWRALLGHLLCMEEDDFDNAPASSHAASLERWYKEGIIHAARAVLASLGAATGVEAPLLAAQLDTGTGSGAALDDWLLGVSGGADDDEGMTSGATEDEGGEPDEGQEPESEFDVYVRGVETFVSDALSVYRRELEQSVVDSSEHWLAAVATKYQAVAPVMPGGGPLGSAVQVWELTAETRAGEPMLRILKRSAGCFFASPASGSIHTLLRLLFQGQASLLQSAEMMGLAATRRVDVDASCLAAAAALLSAACNVYEAAGAVLAAWLPSALLQLARHREECAVAEVAELTGRQLAAGAALLEAASSLRCAALRRPVRRVQLATAQSLLAVTSLGLRAGLKPPGAVLRALHGGAGFAALQAQAHSALRQQRDWPLLAQRALWVALSDLSLRSWPAQLDTFDAGGREAAFSAVAAPLVEISHQALAQLQGDAGAATAAHRALQHVAAISADIVQSYLGSPKAARCVVFQALSAPLEQLSAAVLAACAGAHGADGADAGRSRTAAAQLRLLSATLRTLSSEMGADGAAQLLQQTVQACRAGSNPSLEPELVLLSIIAMVLSVGHSRHQSLVPAAMSFCRQVWNMASQPGAEAADAGHAKAMAVTALLRILRHHWRALVGGGAPQSMATDSAAGDMPHHTAAAAAAAAARGGACAVAQSAEGAVAVGSVVALLLEFFSAAAEGERVLAAADVRAVLEELFDLRVATHLYCSPLFAPALAPLADSLLCMLLSRLHGGAQEQLLDTLYGLASAMGWTEFLLHFVPAFVERRLSWLGPHGADVAGVLGADLGDLPAAAFDGAALRFVNDVVYWQHELGGT